MKKPSWRINWEHHFPPGYEWQTECTAFLFFISFAVAWASFGYTYALSEAADWAENRHIMADFYTLLEGKFRWFPVLIILLLAAMILHYAYHRMGSKSIYLMRRLPNRWEIHRRCVTMPIIGIVSTLVFAAVLLLIFFAFYMIAAPEGTVNPGQIGLLLKNWRAI